MWIKDRIDAEYKKHKDLDWSRLAEAKILSTLNDKVKELKDKIPYEKSSEWLHNLIDKTLGFCTTKVSINNSPSRAHQNRKFVRREDIHAKELLIARRCLNWKGCYCEDKACLNTACPLNEKYNHIAKTNDMDGIESPDYPESQEEWEACYDNHKKEVEDK